MMQQKITCIDPLNPDPDLIHKAGKIICNTGVVIFPAKCLYGVAAHALDERAIERVFQLKQRPKDNPILVLIPDPDMLKELVTMIPEPAKRLMAAFWPGNITLVFQAKDHVSRILTAQTGKIGIRIPSHPVARSLVQDLNAPMTGTSANLSGKMGCTRIDRLDPLILEHADLVLDAGPLKGGAGSTIADVTLPTVRIIREGEITAKQIHETLL